MGRVYQHIGTYLEPTANSVFVEIGSDRGEGSTQWLDAMAADHNKKLITVDVSSKAKSRWETTFVNTEFVVQPGADWAKNFAQSHTDIDVLYLDNFDYIWDINDVRPAIQLQMAEYAERGVAMTNQACQIEHLAQLMLLYRCHGVTYRVFFAADCECGLFHCFGYATLPLVIVPVICIVQLNVATSLLGALPDTPLISTLDCMYWSPLDWLLQRIVKAVPASASVTRSSNDRP